MVVVPYLRSNYSIIACFVLLCCAVLCSLLFFFQFQSFKLLPRPVWTQFICKGTICFFIIRLPPTFNSFQIFFSTKNKTKQITSKGGMRNNEPTKNGDKTTIQKFRCKFKSKIPLMWICCNVVVELFA